MSRFMNTIERIPLRIVAGDGNYLIGEDGQRYLDFWGDEGVASLGYGSDSDPTPVDRALGKFADESSMLRLPDAYPNKLRDEAAEAICWAARFDKVFFCNSGAEANEAAIKLARRYWSIVRGQPGRNVILTVEGNFHGRTGFALAASDSKDSPYHKLGYGPIPEGFGVIHDDLELGNARVWKRDQYVPADGDWQWDEVAAIIMAPILGNNTVKTYPQAFWQKMDRLRQEHGFLIIFDEVQVAMGRTGNFCAHHAAALTGPIRPDICAIGKGIAAGLPAAVILADNNVARAFVPGVHFSTFGASMIVCHMMKEVIQYIIAEGPRIKVDQHNLINYQFKRLKETGHLRGYDGAGLHWGFEPEWSKLRTDGPGFVEAARANGLLLLTHRPYAPIRFTPPLTITNEELEEAFSILKLTLVNLATS